MLKFVLDMCSCPIMYTCREVGDLYCLLREIEDVNEGEHRVA